MCALCGVLVEGPHWTEAGTDAGRAGASPEGRQRYLERVYRLKLLNRVLEGYGCVAEDFAASQYVVRNKAGGASGVAASLPQLWLELETACNRPADPLDPALIARLEKAPPVEH